MNFSSSQTEARDAASPPVPSPSRYAAFISYRHAAADRRWAQWLHAALETYRVPARLRRERTLPVRVGRCFRDEDELPASADLNAEIERALAQSEFLIVVCSPRTPASEWVNREVERFRELGRHDRILALLIEGDPAEAFPRALREIRPRVTAADDSPGDRPDTRAVTEVEPLAADVRPVPGVGRRQVRRTARLRLLASVLGVAFDDLRQRDQERQVRRLAYGISALAATLLVVAGLAVAVVVQRNAAVAQRAVAERNAAVAADQRNLALDTLHQLIVDVQDKLDRPRLMPVKGSILNLALAGLKRIERTAAGAATRADRETAVAHRRLGELYLLLGRTADATDAISRAAALFEALPSDAAEREEDRRGLAAAYVALGETTLRAGDAAASKQHLTRSLRLWEALAADHPHSAVDQRGLGISCNWMGAVILQAGEAAASVPHLERSLRIREALVAANPDDAEDVKYLVYSHHTLGDVRVQLDDLTAALRHRREAVRLCEHLAAIGPEDQDRQRRLAVSYKLLGDTLGDARQHAEAKKYLGEALRILKWLTAADPEHVKDKDLLASTYMVLGDASLAAQDATTARLHLDEALGLFKEIAAADPDNALARYSLVLVYYRLGRAAMVAYKPADAAEFYSLGQRLLDDLIRAGKSKDQPKYERVRTTLKQSLVEADEAEAILQRVAKHRSGNAGGSAKH